MDRSKIKELMNEIGTLKILNENLLENIKSIRSDIRDLEIKIQEQEFRIAYLEREENDRRN
jgi:hypothetical protein